MTHSTGVAHILRARGSARARNAFEEQLLLAQRCSVVRKTPKERPYNLQLLTWRKVLEALLDDKVQMTGREWQELVENKLDPQSAESQAICLLSRVPDIMQRARVALSTNDHAELTVLASESAEIREKFQPLPDVWRARLTDDFAEIVDSSGTCHRSTPQRSLTDSSSLVPYRRRRLAHLIYIRCYAFVLLCGIMINLVGGSLKPHLTGFKDQLRLFAEEIIKLASVWSSYRPLGSLATLYCLTAAYVATEDSQIMRSSLDLLREFASDFYEPADLTTCKTWLERLRRRLTLKDIPRGSAHFPNSF